MNEEYVKIDDVICAIRRRLPTEPFMKRNCDKWFKENEDLILLDEAVCSLPRADVAPVRHGRWYQDAIFYGEDDSPCIVDICTECGAYGDYADFKYCPICGARMDEK